MKIESFAIDKESLGEAFQAPGFMPLNAVFAGLSRGCLRFDDWDSVSVEIRAGFLGQQYKVEIRKGNTLATATHPVGLLQRLKGGRIYHLEQASSYAGRIMRRWLDSEVPAALDDPETGAEYYQRLCNDPDLSHACRQMQEGCDDA